MTKKILTLFCLWTILVILGACSSLASTEDQTTTIVTESTTEAVEIIAFEDLPVHQPEVIELGPVESITGDCWYFIPSYRALFYSVDGLFLNLVDPERLAELDEILNTHVPDGTIEPEEMLLVTIIRTFEIEREDFERALVQRYLNSRFFGESAEVSEGLELPCPDIIYTFDNEIINAFYRRENPVAPDWWPVERQAR